MKRLLLVVLLGVVVALGCASTKDEARDLDKCEMEAQEQCKGDDACYERYTIDCMNKMGYFYE